MHMVDIKRYTKNGVLKFFPLMRIWYTLTIISNGFVAFACMNIVHKEASLRGRMTELVLVVLHNFFVRELPLSLQL